jgi:RNA recognition motif-containing protein
VAWQDLKDLFRECGNVLRANIMYGKDGKSRGYGTVLYSNADEAKSAIGTN